MNFKWPRRLRAVYCQVRGMPYTGSAGGPAGEAAGAPSVFNPTVWSVCSRSDQSQGFWSRKNLRA